MAESTNQQPEQKKGSAIAIVTMFFLFAMVSFVTNMAAPFGNIWTFKYSWAGMMGNLMNFAAYLFMGIPAGRLLVKIGYKKTALTALAVGVIGLAIEFLSSIFGADVVLRSSEVMKENYLGIEEPQTVHLTLNFFIYLLGAFICGFCVCMLNTVVNPMLNLLGGGGNRGNQLIQTGGALNSLTASLTPMLVGVLIGSVTPRTSMGDVAPLLIAGMVIFALSFLVIYKVNIPEPREAEEKGAAKAAAQPSDGRKYSAWSFRHFVLGAIAIFFYVGIEIGIPGEFNLFMGDPTSKGAGILVNGAAIGGSIVMIYWLLMLVGRSLSSAISGKVSTRAQMLTVSAVGTILVLIAILIPKDKTFDVPKFIYNPDSKTSKILDEVGLPTSAIEEFKNDPAGFDWTRYGAPKSDAECAIPECCKDAKPECCADSAECCVEDAECCQLAVAECNADSTECCHALVACAEDNGETPNVAKELYDLHGIRYTEAAGMLDTPKVPICAIFLVLCGLCTSVMWGGIFNLCVEGLGKYTEQASGIFMMLVVGGGIMPLVQNNVLMPIMGYMNSYWLIVAMLLYILWYSFAGCKNVNKDIPV